MGGQRETQGGEAVLPLEEDGAWCLAEESVGVDVVGRVDRGDPGDTEAGRWVVEGWRRGERREAPDFGTSPELRSGVCRDGRGLWRSEGYAVSRLECRWSWEE